LNWIYESYYYDKIQKYEFFLCQNIKNMNYIIMPKY